MSKAYTLIEILIVIGVVAILTGLASLSMVSFGKSGDLETSRVMVIGGLREAQANSLAVLNDKAWGLHLEVNRAIIFTDSGSGFVPGDPNNQVRLLSTGTSAKWDLAGGGQDILFIKRTGKTANFGTISLSGSAADTKTITVNQEGLIE